MGIFLYFLYFLFFFALILNLFNCISLGLYQLIPVYLIILGIRLLLHKSYHKSKLSGLMISAYLDFCFTLYPFLLILDNQIISSSTFYIHSSISFLTLFYFWLTRDNEPPKVFSSTDSIKNLITNKWLLIIITVFYFLISFICFKLNITQMGSPHPKLPFKLEPALNLFRNVTLYTFAYFLISTFFQLKFKKLFALGSLVFFIWLVFEAYIRHSRGAIALGFLPIIYLIWTSFTKIKTKIIVATTFFVICLSSFTITTLLRHKNIHQNSSTSIKISFVNSIQAPFYRLFAEAELLEKFYKHTEGSLFHNNLNKFVSYRGVGNFHNVVIDTIPLPEVANNSSGSTAILEGYFILGIPGVIINLSFLFFLAFLNDRNSKYIGANYLGIKISHYLFIFNLLSWNDGIWSFYFFRSPLTWLVYPLTIISIIIFIKKYHSLSRSSLS